MRNLVVALEQIRTRLLRVIAALEEGDNERALEELTAASEEWQSALEELRT